MLRLFTALFPAAIALMTALRIDGAVVRSIIDFDPTTANAMSAANPGDIFVRRDTGDVYSCNEDGEIVAGLAAGPPGATGPQGETGPQGDTGPQGATGPPGASNVATTAIAGIARVDNDSAGNPQSLTAAGHLLDADPHSQYVLDTEKGAASGVATLDGTSKLTASQLPLGTTGATAAAGNDARLSDSRAPTAHKVSHQDGGSDEISVTGLSGVLADPQPPIIGATGTTAVAGNDSRLTNARTPTAHATTHDAGGTDAMAADAAAATASLRSLGTTATKACAGNDSRLSDSRTPTAHATSHKSGGSDAIKLDELAAPTDITTLDASASAHGLLPKLGGGTTNFLRADGTWAAPAIPAAATQAEQETGTSTTAFVTPGRQQFHLSACKCFGFTTGAGTPALHANSYNVTSIADTAPGRLTVTIGTDFSSANWAGIVSTTNLTNANRMACCVTKAAGSVILESSSATTTLADPGVGWDWSFFGDQ